MRVWPAEDSADYFLSPDRLSAGPAGFPGSFQGELCNVHVLNTSGRQCISRTCGQGTQIPSSSIHEAVRRSLMVPCLVHRRRLIPTRVSPSVRSRLLLSLPWHSSTASDCHCWGVLSSGSCSCHEHPRHVEPTREIHSKALSQRRTYISLLSGSAGLPEYIGMTLFLQSAAATFTAFDAQRSGRITLDFNQW
jgi:hypothetical protein